MVRPLPAMLRRSHALVRKEFLQVLRDPAALMIAFILPPVLLFLYAFAVSLDVTHVKLGVVLESDSANARSLASAFSGSRYLSVMPARHRREVEHLLVTGELRGFVVIPQDFEEQLLAGGSALAIQIITDGSQPNTAHFVDSFSRGVFYQWLAAQQDVARAPPVIIEQRFWFNPELESRRVLLPGSIAIVMTLIGTMLTALVVAREWERGTMEAVLATAATPLEVVASKLLPYFVLGTLATLGCVLLTVGVFDVPLRGSMSALLLLNTFFLFPALGQGLLISTIARNQFVAAQMAVMSGFLPAFILSGFLFEIESMPRILQWLTVVIPARYFVSSLQTIFLAGDVWSQFARDMFSMWLVGMFFLLVTMMRYRRGLD